MSFEANDGQSDPSVRFLARGDGYALFLTPNEAVLSIRAPGQRERATGSRSAVRGGAAGGERPRPTSVVRMRLTGAAERPQMTGLDRQLGTSNYFIGKDPGRWQRDVPHYSRVEYAEVYPGIDLIYYGNQRQLEYDFVVAPGADPGMIALTTPTRSRPLERSTRRRRAPSSAAASTTSDGSWRLGQSAPTSLVAAR